MRSRFRLRGSGDESCSSMKDPEPRESGGGIILEQRFDEQGAGKVPRGDLYARDSGAVDIVH